MAVRGIQRQQFLFFFSEYQIRGQPVAFGTLMIVAEERGVEKGTWQECLPVSFQLAVTQLKGFRKSKEARGLEIQPPSLPMSKTLASTPTFDFHRVRPLVLGLTLRYKGTFLPRGTRANGEQVIRLRLPILGE